MAMSVWGRGRKRGGSRLLSACLAMVLVFTLAWPSLLVYAFDEAPGADAAAEAAAEDPAAGSDDAPVQQDVPPEAGEVDVAEPAIESPGLEPVNEGGVTEGQPVNGGGPEGEPSDGENGATGCIAVYKFRDDDRDEQKDPWEPWVEGWEFTLYDKHGTFIERKTTNENGQLCFSQVPVGKYLVRETLRDGWLNVSPQNQEVHVLPWQTSHLWFANAFQTGCIAVHKFEDLDRDEHKDSDERMLAGWEFTLYDSEGGFVASGTTNEQGELWFSSVPIGEYLVRETLQDGWVNVTPVNQTVTVCDWRTTHVWFANAPDVSEPETGSLLVHKFEDLDEDGELDTGEPMLEDWQFTVLGQDAAVLDSGFTGPDGTVLFDGLPVGDVTVVETLEEGWTSTTGTSHDAVIAAGETTHVFFGNVRETQGQPTGVLRIQKFRDTNGNMLFDPTEGPLAGWFFTVRDAAGAIVGTGTTNAGGTLEFVLPAGTYSVTETLAEGWMNTTPATQSAVVIADQTVTVSFGNVEEPSLPFTETPRPTRPSEPFLPFTGGELMLLLAAASASGTVGFALRRRSRKAA